MNSKKNTNDTSDTNEITEYSHLIDLQFSTFQKNNQFCCKALTHSNLQCKHKTTSQLLCKLHRNKKHSPDYIIVYIHNDNDNKKYGNGNRNGTGDDSHIIAYSYKNKEKYYKDIDIYKTRIKRYL